MRTILVLALVLVFAASGRAAAQTPPDPPAICNTWRSQWNDVSAGAVASPMRTFLNRVPATCRNLRRQIEAFIAARFPQSAPPPPAGSPGGGAPAGGARPPSGQAPAQTADARRFRDCSTCPEMVVVPAGSFTMGSPASEPGRERDEGPQRRIEIARPFAVGRTEVTRGQYAAFTGATGRAAGANCMNDRDNDGDWERDARGTWRDPGFAQDEDHPVVCVAWEDAQAYVQWLNSLTGGGYRLLTEAEWEYAARAGTANAFVWGADANAGCAYANGADATARGRFPAWPTSTCNDNALYTASVASYRPNAFGLYDMSGNVWEWVQDCHQGGIEAVPQNGAANERGNCAQRVARGGSWYFSPQYIRSAARFRFAANYRNYIVGFRVAKTMN